MRIRWCLVVSDRPVFVLAAGEATRLFPFGTLMPKTLLPVGNQPFIRWLMARFEGHPVTICCLKADLGLFQWEFRDRPDIKFLTSEKPMGTAGQLSKIPKNELGEMFAIWYGDCYVNANISDIFHSLYIEGELDAVLVHSPVAPSEYGISILDEDNRITRFQEKGSLQLPIWSGVGVFRTKTFPLWMLKEGNDFAKHIHPAMLKRGQKIRAYMEPRYVDIGTYPAYQRVRSMADRGELWR